jgi:hypothetical protein
MEIRICSLKYILPENDQSSFFQLLYIYIYIFRYGYNTKKITYRKSSIVYVWKTNNDQWQRKDQLFVLTN